MSDIRLRPATAADQDTIRHMVRAAELDPTALHWSHFIVAEAGSQVVGIGQVRPYPNCRELGSLVVQAEFRQQGVGAEIVQALLARESGVVYLECLDHNESYYQRFGFRRVSWWRVPMPLKLKAGLGQIWAAWRISGCSPCAATRPLMRVTDPGRAARWSARPCSDCGSAPPG